MRAQQRPIIARGCTCGDIIMPNVPFCWLDIETAKTCFVIRKLDGNLTIFSYPV